MSEMVNDQTAERLERLQMVLDRGTPRTVRGMLNDLYPAETARLLESMTPGKRIVVFQLVEESDRGEVLIHVADEVRAGLIDQLTPEALFNATNELDLDDLADILDDLPDIVIKELLTSMDRQNRERLEAVLGYAEDSAGGLMNTDTITVRPDVTFEVVLRYLRMLGSLPDHTNTLFVVDRLGHYLGLLPLTDLLLKDAGEVVRDVMDINVHAINANLPASEVATLFENRDLVSAPVVDDQNMLLGRITIDDVVDVIREEAEHTLLSQAGLDEEDDIFAPVVISARRRGVWLGINLFTAFLAAWVVGRFEVTLSQVTALAILMPVVASMGGIAGSQTLTLMIRGLALGQIGRSNRRQLLRKELLVGLLNGLFWSIVVASVASLWFQDLMLGLVIGLALILNQACAAISGVVIPLVLKKMGVDPALAGSVILTTVTDIVGFAAFLGLGALLLL